MARGFASLSPERRRQIASMGGKAVKPENRSFARDKELARAAGVRGGHALPAEKRSFSVSREQASEAGKKGGAARRAKREAEPAPEPEVEATS